MTRRTRLLATLIVLASSSLGCAGYTYHMTQRGETSTRAAYGQCSSTFDLDAFSPLWDAADSEHYMTNCLAGKDIEVYVTADERPRLSPVQENQQYQRCMDEARDADVAFFSRNSMCIDLNTRRAFLLGRGEAF